MELNDPRSVAATIFKDDQTFSRSVRGSIQSIDKVLAEKRRKRQKAEELGDQKYLNLDYDPVPKQYRNNVIEKEGQLKNNYIELKRRTTESGEAFDEDSMISLDEERRNLEGYISDVRLASKFVNKTLESLDALSKDNPDFIDVDYAKKKAQEMFDEWNSGETDPVEFLEKWDYKTYSDVNGVSSEYQIFKPKSYDLGEYINTKLVDRLDALAKEKGDEVELGDGRTRVREWYDYDDAELNQVVKDALAADKVLQQTVSEKLSESTKYGKDEGVKYLVDRMEAYKKGSTQSLQGSKNNSNSGFRNGSYYSPSGYIMTYRKLDKKEFTGTERTNIGDKNMWANPEVISIAPNTNRQNQTTTWLVTDPNDSYVSIDLTPNDIRKVGDNYVITGKVKRKETSKDDAGDETTETVERNDETIQVTENNKASIEKYLGMSVEQLFNKFRNQSPQTKFEGVPEGGF